MNQQARALIIEHVSDSFLDDVIGIDDAKSMWEALVEVCATYDIYQETLFLKEMVNTEKKDDESMI